MENTAVVVNELGDIGLDNLIIAQATDNVVLLDAGCLCCANTGALHETLADLVARRAQGTVPPFERVIIETSGAADPAPLLNVLLGHPLLTGSYALAATVCVVDAQHFLASRREYPELDKQAAIAERIVITKKDLADAVPVAEFLQELNPDADIVESIAEMFLPGEKKKNVVTSISSLGPIRNREHFSGIRAFSYRPPSPISWSGWAAWSRLVKLEFGARLIRVKGLLQIADGPGTSGEIAFVQGVQGVFHPPQRLPEWPDADHGNRLVCIARDLREADIAATLPALNAAPGTQAHYSLEELQQRQAQQ